MFFLSVPFCGSELLFEVEKSSQARQQLAYNSWGKRSCLNLMEKVAK